VFEFSGFFSVLIIFGLSEFDGFIIFKSLSVQILNEDAHEICSPTL